MQAASNSVQIQVSAPTAIKESGENVPAELRYLNFDLQNAKSTEGHPTAERAHQPGHARTMALPIRGLCPDRGAQTGEVLFIDKLS